MNLANELGHDDHDDNDDHGEEGSSIMTAKIVIVVVMLLCSCFVFLPFTKKCSSNGNRKEGSGRNIFFAVSACFAAGLLMSISVLHILPEANEMYEGVLKKWEIEEEAEHMAELADLWPASTWGL